MLSINNTTKQAINSQKIQALAGKFWRVYKLADREVSLALVGPAAIRRLNRKYRGIDKATDVLSFPAGPIRGENTKYLGEIIINLTETKKLSKYREMFEEIGMEEFAVLSCQSDLSQKKRHAIENYLFYFLLVHGLLHLLGYDDRNEKSSKEMLKIGQSFLARNLP
ncbi:MAG: rRNA maturation RNase YbeY [Patescibacteria group bacterium]